MLNNTAKSHLLTMLFVSGIIIEILTLKRMYIDYMQILHANLCKDLCSMDLDVLVTSPGTSSSRDIEEYPWCYCFLTLVFLLFEYPGTNLPTKFGICSLCEMVPSQSFPC